MEKVVKTVAKLGFDGFAITDHNEVEGSLRAAPLARKYKLRLIPGYELKTKQGDILVYGTRELVKPGLPLDESIELLREIGALVIAAHPFSFFRKGIGRNIRSADIDGIEVANGHDFLNSILSKIAVSRNLAQLGGSDAHVCFEIGNAYTVCDEDPLSAIRKRTTSGVGGLSIKTMPFAALYSTLSFPKRAWALVKKWTNKQ